MAGLSSIGFLAPGLLLGLVALPVLWWLLRAIPPAAIRRRFPAVALLLGLKDAETTPHKTPWWLLLLRALAIGAAIVGFAGPVLNPKEGTSSTGPLLVLLDGSWASAADWSKRQDQLTATLTEAARYGRPTALVVLSQGLPESAQIPFRSARDVMKEVATLHPSPWAPDYPAFQAALEDLPDTAFDTIWFSDALARDGRGNLALELQRHGAVTVVEGGGAVLALRPPAYHDGRIGLVVLRARAGLAQKVLLNAFGPDPTGVERRLAQMPVEFKPDDLHATTEFDLPSELRNRINRFAIAAKRSAGAVALADDALKRRKVALFAGQRPREGQELVTALHFLRKALAPTAELIEAPVADSLRADPDVVILADVARLNASETAALKDWVEKGGLLLRFAGPRLAATGLAEIDADELLPVRLRAGGRNVGGAMSWGSPKHLQAFEKESPFFGLAIPEDVVVSSQVLAQPDPKLSARTIASLQDGTPLVTRKKLGDGQVVLFHVTANAEWSTLPLSGLFVSMLERLAVSARRATPSPEDLAGQLWQPDRVMNAFGDISDGNDLISVPGERLATGTVGADLMPGTYKNAEREIAVNVIAPDREILPANWPTGVRVTAMQGVVEQPLKAMLLALALGALILDIVATLWLSGRLTGPARNVLPILLAAILVMSGQADAGDSAALSATSGTVLAYVKTGDARLDATSEAGLFGLSKVLSLRTSVEPSDPIGVDLETDELAFFPLIYWPISETQKMPSDAAYESLNAYLRRGGMILFDTRDANLGAVGSSTPNGRRLRQLAAPLDIPALEPIPRDHVLTRSFYLLHGFPGRFARSDVWVEAAPPDAVRAEGMPFRNLNDGVSPVVMGGNDWAAAWAITRQGDFMFPVGRGGNSGERQREIAFRFGINLVMYVLTGNYKSDQVHVPALLERLGQ